MTHYIPLTGVMLSDEPLRHDWERQYGISHRWVCTRCRRRSRYHNTLGPQSICHGDSWKPTYAALESEVAAFRLMAAEFA